LPTRNVQLNATLVSDSTPLADKTITFMHKLSSETQWITDGTANTNSSGVATFTVSLEVPNTYDFRAEFAGDEDYEPSYAEVDNYRVKAKTTLTLVVTPQ
jgi:hypothetical protein